MNTKRIKMRISDIHFRDIEPSDIQKLMCPEEEYKPQIYKDANTGEIYEIDLTDWRDALKKLCKSPNQSLWTSKPP